MWQQQEQKKLIAEFAIEEAAREILDQELRLIPAFYGWKVEDENPYRPVPFSGLKPYLDDPRFERGIQDWIFRLQSLRFRQSPAFNQEVDAYQQAGQLAVLASRVKGKKRDRRWLEAVEVYSGNVMKTRNEPSGTFPMF